MASVLAPKKPDTSAQQKALADQEARIKQQEQETQRREAASSNARRRRSRTSLITGSETGVLREQLG